MQFTPPARASYDVHVLTTRYLYLGRVEPLGQFLVWLNEPQVHAVPVAGLTCIPLEVGRNTDPAAPSRVQITKNDIVALDILSPAARQTEQLMTRRVPMTFTTDLFIISGLCPMMADLRPEDVLNNLKGPFLALLSAKIQPIVNMRPLPFSECAMLLLNTQHIATYRPD